MTYVPESFAVGVLFLAAFVLFAAALVVQFRGGAWLPRWVPATVRRSQSQWGMRLAAIAWCGAWTFGGQALVILLAVDRLSEGHYAAASILLAELGVAAAVAAQIVRASDRRSAA